MASDSATEHKTDAIEGGASSSLPGEDLFSNAVPVENQDLGTGSTFCGLGEALMQEKDVQMDPSAFDPGEKRGSQDCQESEIPTEEGAQMEQLDQGSKMPLNDLEVADDFDGVESLLLEVRKRQLLDELEGGSIFRDMAPFERSGERTLITDVDTKKFPDGVDRYLRSSLKIKVIDETALIEPVILPGIGNVNTWKSNLKEDLEGKKAKRARKRGKGKKTGLEKAGVVVRKIGDGTKMMYSREELETLRFVGVAEQRKLWKEIYNGLGEVVAREYMSLGSSKQHQPLRPVTGPGILGQDCGKEAGDELEKWEGKEMSNSNSLGQNAACGDDSTNFDELDGEEDSEDSDEFYASIQRPAFSVEGEPNFEAGPPEDGLEYLRRVRWEAAQIPNVKVAKLDETKLNKEQSVYMPVIPEIAKCPEYLMPSKRWEDEFLADFSKLRLAFSQAEASRVEASDRSEVKFILGDKTYSTDLTLLGNGGPEDETKAATNAETSSSKVLRTNLGSGSPTLSLLLSMDSVARVSNLRKRVNGLEARTALSRDECLWVFALCAAIDTPLHGDTCATLRCLLRKCATLRAQEEVDDEVIMLNILATISGRFFGQSESEI